MRVTLLLVAAKLCVVEARRVPTRSALDRPTVGDALELRVPWNSDYLPGKQVVGVISPNSVGPRRFDISKKAFVGARDAKGLTWRVQEEWKPLKRIRQRRPFKVRILRLDTEGILGLNKANGKLNVEEFQVPYGPYKGKVAIAVSVRKKPWYKRLL